jgi:hypothetical protein
MDANLPESAYALWRFLFPSVVHLGILIGLLFFLAPTTLDLGRARLRTSNTEGLLAALNSKTAEAIGLNKLAPFLTLFVILLLMVVANDTARWVGDVMPPVMFWTSPNDLLATGRTEELLNIWGHYSNIRNVEQLTDKINDLYNEHSTNSGFSFWQDRVRLADTVVDRIKVYTLWSLLCAAIGLRQRRHALAKRLAVVLSLLTVCFALSVAYAVHSYSHFSESRIIVAQRWSSRSDPIAVSSEEVAARRQALTGDRAWQTTWWRLGLPSWTW